MTLSQIQHEIENNVDIMYYLLAEEEFGKTCQSIAVFDSMARNLVGLNDIS